MTALQAKTNSYYETKPQTPNKRVNHLFHMHFTDLKHFIKILLPNILFQIKKKNKEKV